METALGPKKTPLYDKHISLNASMVDFNGWLMPIQYDGIISEHNAVRKSAGIFDICHMGVIEAAGADAMDFCQYVITNDMKKISDGKILYTPVCNEKGGAVDDVLVYRFNKDLFHFVVNASNIEKDFKFISGLKKNLKVNVKNLSSETGIIAVQGPNSLPLVELIFGKTAEKIPYYGFVETELDGEKIVLSRTGYTGEIGFEIYFKRDNTVKYWDLFSEKGKRFGLKPIGLGARDTLRLEMGYCLYGHEINDSISPLEAGLSWTISFNKGDFAGKKALIEEKQKGSKRKLIAFKMIDKSIPRAGNPLKGMGKVIGNVTSGSFSPSLKVGVGLGYVENLYAVTNSEVAVNIRGKDCFAEIVKLPFYTRKVK